MYFLDLIELAIVRSFGMEEKFGTEKLRECFTVVLRKWALSLQTVQMYEKWRSHTHTRLSPSIAPSNDALVLSLSLSYRTNKNESRFTGHSFPRVARGERTVVMKLWARTTFHLFFLTVAFSALRNKYFLIIQFFLSFTFSFDLKWRKIWRVSARRIH